MKDNCRDCKKIVWFKNDNFGRYFEDSDYKIFHNCPALHFGKKQQWDDHVLLAITVTRVSELEKEVAKLKQKSDTEIKISRSEVGSIR